MRRDTALSLFRHLTAGLSEAITANLHAIAAGHQHPA